MTTEFSVTPVGPPRGRVNNTVRNVFALYFENAEWMDDGLCAQTDPEAFFPERGASTRAAKKVCLACTVHAECLTYALDHKERFGIWGSLSERERRAMDRTHVA